MNSMVIKKCLVVGIIVLLVGMSIIPSTSAEIVEKYAVVDNEVSAGFVNAGGNTLYVGGDGPGNYTKIQDALDDASDGDTVYVFNDSSPYYENIKIDKSIRLIGEDRNTTVIDGRRKNDVLYLDKDGITVSGFTIQNGGGSGDNTNGINIRSDYNTISGNIITRNRGDGIYLHKSSYNNVTENIILDNDAPGIYDYQGDENIILNNTIENNKKSGIYLCNSIWQSHIGDKVIQNNIRDNGRNGIYLYSGEKNIISGNNISNNGKNGIMFHISNENIIWKNDITNNKNYGIELALVAYPSTDNMVYLNNFINNSPNAYDDHSNEMFGNRWYNLKLWRGNYWDDYTGRDWNGNGIGDLPYKIPGEKNWDIFPLMNPVDITQTSDQVIQKSRSINHLSSYDSLSIKFLESFPLLKHTTLNLR